MRVEASAPAPEVEEIRSRYEATMKRLPEVAGNEDYDDMRRWAADVGVLLAAAPPVTGAEVAAVSYDERVRRALYSVWPGLGQDDARRVVTAIRPIIEAALRSTAPALDVEKVAMWLHDWRLGCYYDRGPKGGCIADHTSIAAALVAALEGASGDE